LTVDFTDLSSDGPTSWNWDFGDGSGTSSAQNPTYEYTSAGTYTVTLTATNSCGSDGETKIDYIVVDPPCGTKAFALSDIPVKGSVSGDYTDTYNSDDVYEVLTEGESGGKPSRRYSTLEHKWNFNVTAGATVVFFVEGYRPDNAEGDNFSFEYSTDDVNYTSLVAINSSTEQTYSASMPSSVSGTVYIRVVDTDHGQGNQVSDDVYVDYMYIESGGTPPPPATIFVYSIDVTRIGGKGGRYQGQAVVTIHNAGGSPVGGVAVSGEFSGPSSSSESGTTAGDGTVTFTAQKVKNPSGVWCFAVTDVSRGSDVYDAGLNVETSDCEAAVKMSVAGNLPQRFELAQNHPNPFNPKTSIRFSLPEGSNVRMDIFNIMGQKMATLVDNYMEAGFHTVEWDGSRAASGIYFYRIETDQLVDTRKMVLLK
jgi:PKD repeat protein